MAKFRLYPHALQLKKNTHQRINIVFFQRHVAFPCFLFLFFFLQQCCGFICFYKMANTTRSVRLTTFNRKCKEIVNDQLWEGLSRPESKSAFIILIRTQKQKLSILFYVYKHFFYRQENNFCKRYVIMYNTFNFCWPKRKKRNLYWKL